MKDKLVTASTEGRIRLKIFERILKKCEVLSKQITIENERNMMLQEEFERVKGLHLIQKKKKRNRKGYK